MQIDSNTIILDPDGNPVKEKDSLKYLGAMLHKTGRMDSEIASKIGEAKQAFRTLMQIWKHANIAKVRKIQFYKALVLSKLLYGLQTIWLSKGLRQKIKTSTISIY